MNGYPEGHLRAKDSLELPDYIIIWRVIACADQENYSGGGGGPMAI